jgi:hypothetical protein
MLGNKLVLHDVDHQLALSENIYRYRRATLTHSLRQCFASLRHHHLANDKYGAFDPVHRLDFLEHVSHGGCGSLLLVHKKNHAHLARSVGYGKVQRVAAGEIKARFKMLKVTVPAKGVTRGQGWAGGAKTHMTGTMYPRVSSMDESVECT